MALTGYTLYQVWAGITTNESGKWENTSLDIADELLFKRPLDDHRLRDSAEPHVKWPVRPKVVALSSEVLPASDESGLAGRGHGTWVPVNSIHEFENLYDIGFWRNMGDIFLPRSVFEKWLS